MKQQNTLKSAYKLSRHYLDWDNKPIPFKIYTKLPSIALPSDLSQPNLDAITSVRTQTNQLYGDSHYCYHFDIKKLAEILFFSAGITREMKGAYVTDQKLTLEILKEISDCEVVLQVSGEYTGCSASTSPSHELRNQRNSSKYSFYG